VLRCDRSLSSESESAITVPVLVWIWFGMAIPWYSLQAGFLHASERLGVTFSIAFASVCVCQWH